MEGKIKVTVTEVPSLRVISTSARKGIVEKIMATEADALGRQLTHHLKRTASGMFADKWGRAWKLITPAVLGLVALPARFKR